MKIYLYKLFLILVIVSTESYSQIENIKFERVVTEKGLSSGTINSILKDNFGFIWLGTSNGLMRYDGYNFKEFKHDPSDSNSISGNRIWSIIQDRYGDLWIGTSGKGLSKYLYKEDRFVHYWHNAADSSSLADDDEVTWITEDSNGIIWIALWEGGVDQYDRTNNSFIHHKHKPDEANTLVNNSAHRILEDKKGFLWIGTSRGLSKYDRVNKKFTAYKHNPSDVFSIAGDYINSILEDKAGNLWIGTYGGLSKYNYSTDKFTNYCSGKNDPHSISSNSVYSLCEDLTGNLWVGTDGGGLNYLNVKSEVFTRYLSNVKTDNSLNVTNIPILFMDDNSILWIGTLASGLYKVVYNKNKFGVISKTSEANSLSFNVVSSVLEDKYRNIWIGTHGGGLDKYDIKSNKFTHYKQSVSSNSISNNFILSLLEDTSGNLWIGTENGLNFFDQQKNKFTQYHNNPNDSNSISGNKVTSLLKDKKGKLWIGTNGGGLNILDEKKQTFTNLTENNDYPGLTSYHVWALFEDSFGNIWCGTWGEGAFKYDYAKGKFIKLNTTLKNKDSVNMDIVVSFAEDKNSNIWLGTWGNGIYKLDSGTNEITDYSQSKGIPHENMYGILCDDSGYLWISSGHGLSKFDPSKNNWKTYEEADGIQSLEFWRGAYHKGRSGRFYFGGVEGLNYFYPEKVADNKNMPAVVFTSLKIMGKEVSPTRFGNDINRLDEIVLPYDVNFISFEFSALEFTNPSDNQYAYMLKGLDENWTYSESRRYVSYSDLKPGEYTFMVKASNDDGVWNNEARVQMFIIKPPLWMTWYAYTFYSVLFLLLLYTFRKYELNKRRLKEEARIRLQQEEAELREAKLKTEAAELKAKAIESEKEFEKQQIRNRIAADLHDEIGSNLSSIILLSSLMTNQNTSDEENNKHLIDINQAAKTSANSIRDIVWFVNPSSDHLNKLISRMHETANTMLKGIHVNFSTDNISFTEKINPEVKRNFFMIYKEILNNIVKHAKAAEVFIRIGESDGKFKLTINDNGIGFDKAINPDGNGLTNLKNRASDIGASLNIESVSGKGTDICVEIEITRLRD